MNFPLRALLLFLLAAPAILFLLPEPEQLQPAERAALLAGVADPRHFGSPVPFPEPALPSGVDDFNPPSYAISDKAPAIAEVSKTAGRNEVISMTGVDLTEPSAFKIFSQGRGAAKGTIISTKPLLADQVAATALLPGVLPPWSMYLLWPVRGEHQGPPVALNRTEAWWIGPEAVAPGEITSVYGRNLARSNGTKVSHIYIHAPGSLGWYLRPIAVNPFRVEFKTPDLPPAVYEVWVHNSHGGRFGWSGPLKFEILAQSPWANQAGNMVDVRDFGATGNGVADDTRSIDLALERARDSAPATIYFPAGTYRVTSALRAPANVTWLGDGKDKTEIRLTRTISEGMISAEEDNIQFTYLTLTDHRKTGDFPALSLFSARNIRLEGVRIDAWGTAALDAQNVSGLFIHTSELIENGSFYGTSRQVFLFDNKFRMTGYGESVVALWGGRDFSMIGNELTNADETRDDGHGIGRFFVGQAHYGSMQNLYWERNKSRNAAPHDCNKVDCNKGEQICFEIENSKIQDGFIAASKDSVSFRDLSDLGAPLHGGRDLVVVAGRGAGQWRRIQSVSGSSITLATDWNVIPDGTSQFAIAATASRAVIYKNTFEGRASYGQHDSDSTGVLLYGNVYDVVVDSNDISQMRHGMMTVALESTRGLSPYFLQYSRNRVRHSNSGLYIGTTFADSGIKGVWGGLGNIYRKNEFKDIAYIGVEFETWDHPGGDYNGTVFDRNSFENLPYGFVDAYKLMWTHDGRFQTGPPDRSRRFNTILNNNRFRRGTAKAEGSFGFLTLHPDNTWRNSGSTWTGFANGNKGPL